MCFGSLEMDSKKQQQLLLRGLHAFQLYAQEHWIDHLLVIGASEGGFDPVLKTLMGKLSGRLEQMYPHDAQTVSGLSTDLFTSMDPRLSSIDHLPGLYRDGIAILKARKLSLRATRGTTSSHRRSHI